MKPLEFLEHANAQGFCLYIGSPSHLNRTWVVSMRNPDVPDTAIKAFADSLREAITQVQVEFERKQG